MKFNGILMMEQISKANALYRAGEFREALSLYENIALNSEWTALVQANVESCRRKIFNRSVKMNSIVPEDNLPNIVIVMTVDGSRLLHLPGLIESILNQTLKPFRIDLNISPQLYSSNQGVAPDDPVLKRVLNIPLLRVKWVQSTGSYKKIWPYLDDFFSNREQEDEIFVTISDAIFYPEFFLQRLYEEHKRHDCVVAYRGRHIELDDNEILSPKEWSLGRVKPTLNNIPDSNAAIIYSTKFFTKDFLNTKVAQRIDPIAGDLWIKWHYTLNGVPTLILNPLERDLNCQIRPAMNHNKFEESNAVCDWHDGNRFRLYEKESVIIRELEDYFMGVYGYNLSWLIRSEQEMAR
jgi:hypothetical protein